MVDRMDNMVQLQMTYGSGPLEELNVSKITAYYKGPLLLTYQAQIYPYRRNVAGSINLTLFAVQSSLTTKVALPNSSLRLGWLIFA